MRILKYIFLLLVLFAVAVSVFVATQKGDYEVTRTKVINSPRNIVFSYVNDYRNWPDWISWDSDIKPEYPNVTAGKGGSFSWKGNENEGSAHTIFVKENDSISQKMTWNGMPAEMSWTFKDSVGKTKVTLRVKGKIGFMPKIYAALKGGPEKIMNTMYKNSLVALDKTLDYEINTYKIKVDGIVEKTASNYLCQTITSTFDNMPLNMRVMMSKLLYFFKKNNIPMGGKPFVRYDYYDTSKKLSKFSVCIPIRDEIYTSPGSDVSFGKFAAFRAVKTTLNGDYSHIREAWDKTFAFIHTNNITEADSDYLELYQIGKEDAKGPSKWVTEIYIPVKEAAAPKATAPLPATKTETAPAETVKPKPQQPAEDISIP